MFKVLRMLLMCACIRGELDLSYNSLTAVPWDNLVGETEVNLAVNYLDSVGTIPTALIITRLDLSSNDFETFPDFAALRMTLEIFDLYNNIIKSINPPELLSQLSVLAELSLSYNPLVTFPDVKYIPHNLFYLSLDHTYL